MMAKIDDCLVQKKQVGRSLRSILRRRDFTGLFDPCLEDLCEETEASEPEIIQGLFDLLLEGRKPSDTLAFILLKDLDSDLVSTRVVEYLGYPHLTRMQRRRIEAIQMSRSVDLLTRDIHDPISHPGLAITQRILEVFSQKTLEDEEAGGLWLWATRMILPSVRGLLLSSIFEGEGGGALAAAAVEIQVDHAPLVARVARLLGTRPEIEADERLRMLENHPNLDVRMEAVRAREQRMQLDPIDPRPRLVRARLHENPTTGLHVLVYGVEDPPGHGKGFAAILDTWDCGIVDCWGQNRLLPKDLDVLLSFAGRLGAVSKPRDLDGRLARGWLEKAEDLSLRRGFPFPGDWSIWKRLLRATPDAVFPPEDTVFGLICHECRSPIRRATEGKKRPLVVGPVALCVPCLEKERQCDHCHRPLKKNAMHVVTHPQSHTLDFYCDSCYAKRTSPRISRP